ncbi:MAG: hypothetical protein NT034_01530, partial [Candidatus Magasanikbacteria bacterium]|nr:hypothetical protein [Candidatus Magasanikbacteria bacterium]
MTFLKFLVVATITLFLVLVGMTLNQQYHNLTDTPAEKAAATKEKKEEEAKMQKEWLANEAKILLQETTYIRDLRGKEPICFAVHTDSHEFYTNRSITRVP